MSIGSNNQVTAGRDQSLSSSRRLDARQGLFKAGKKMGYMAKRSHFPQMPTRERRSKFSERRSMSFGERNTKWVLIKAGKGESEENSQNCNS